MYTDQHKHFFQYLLKRQCVEVKIAVAFSQTLKDEWNNKQVLKHVLSEINSNIVDHDLYITISKCEVTGNDMLVLLNTTNDNVIKLQNSFKSIELEYFKLILKEIIVNEEHKIEEMYGLNLCDSLASTFRKDNAERLLERWCKEGYLIKKNSCFYLGIRGLLEFTPYFRSHCKEYYSTCILCSDLVFYGQDCSACKKIMHNHCFQKYLLRQGNCPSCKSELKSTAKLSAQSEINSADQTNDSEDVDSGPNTKKRRVR